MKRGALVVLCFLLILSLSQSGFSDGMKNKIGLSVRGGFGKHFLADKDVFNMGPFGSAEVKFGVHENLMVGLIGTYGPTSKKEDEPWYLEADVTDIQKNYLIDLAFWYYFAPESDWDPYLNLGAGFYSWHVKDEARENVMVSFGEFDTFRLRDHEMSILFGLGLEYHVDEYFSVGFGAKFHYLTKVNSYLAEKELNGSNLTEENYLGLANGLGEIFAGVTIYHLAKKDSDKDGVADKEDACPDTPLGCLVDANGCPLDSDGDDVCDGLDRCPDTPRGCEVDLAGCTRDTDDDGVCDGLDRCADTPREAQVDSRGCPLDSDGDGVPDHRDRCPDTPRGCQVDADGCSVDSDGDGVCDGLDRCPDEGAGFPVDDQGCWKVEIIEEVVLDEDVGFAVLEYALSPEAQQILDDFIYSKLVEYPDLRIRIEGHCDTTGTDAINIPLSQQRAEAVKEYLVAKGINPDRLEALGYGSSQPKDLSNNVEALARNRRVEFRVIK